MVPQVHGSHLAVVALVALTAHVGEPETGVNEGSRRWRWKGKKRKRRKKNRKG